MKINIIGAGFVGLTLAEVLSGQDSIEKITIIDVDKNKIDAIKEGKLPVSEKDLELKSPKLVFTSDIAESDGDIFFVCVGTPNDYSKKYVDVPYSICVQETEYLEKAVESIVAFNKKATIIIKSTTLPENVALVAEKVDPLFGKILTNPEFLAEGKAVDDMRHQSQLIVGCKKADAEYARELMMKIFAGTYEEMFCIGLYEAMVVKYFVNSYKAQKLNFINEFRIYCAMQGMSFKEVIESIKDPVMGTGFDKPGVGFGGSCFPKDTAAIGNHVVSCHAAHMLNEALISNFAEMCNLEESSTVLIGGKAFKNGTNDIRESVSVKVANIWSKKYPNLHIYFYDQLPELSDLTLDEVCEQQGKFDFIVLFNDLPELVEIFDKEEYKDRFVNTRKVS